MDGCDVPGGIRSFRSAGHTCFRMVCNANGEQTSQLNRHISIASSNDLHNEIWTYHPRSRTWWHKHRLLLTKIWSQAKIVARGETSLQCKNEMSITSSNCISFEQHGNVEHFLSRYRFLQTQRSRGAWHRPEEEWTNVVEVNAMLKKGKDEWGKDEWQGTIMVRMGKLSICAVKRAFCKKVKTIEHKNGAHPMWNMYQHNVWSMLENIALYEGNRSTTAIKYDFENQLECEMRSHTHTHTHTHTPCPHPQHPAAVPHSRRHWGFWRRKTAQTLRRARRC